MRFHLAIAFALTVLSVGPVLAQGRPPGESLAGVIKAVNGNDITVTTKTGDVTVTVVPQSRLQRRHGGSLDDIKPGAYLGTANQDGTGLANEVHVSERGPLVNFPMNDQGLTMTNGHVKSVTKTDKGHEMDIDYGQGTTRHVVVTKDTTLTKMDTVKISDLKPGTQVGGRYVVGADGKHTLDIITFNAPK